jgi:ATP phosphoribosyltransferase
MTSPTIDPIRLALPSKGHLYEGVIEILKTAGYKVRRASDRQYEATISGHPRFHVVFMRPTDIVTQVEEGRCHLGVTGMDLFAGWSSRCPRAGSTSATSSTSWT